MGGLGLGNMVLGRRADAVASSLLMYARLELAISAIGMCSPFLVQIVRAVYLAIGGQELLGMFGATVIRLILAALVIGPATFLMGGTLPAAARSVTRSDDVSRSDVGWLYGLNTFGAVLGSLVSTFFLLEHFGNRETLLLAGAVNLLNGGAAWWLADNQPVAAATHESVQPPKKKHREKDLVQPAFSESVNREAAVLPALVYAAAAVVGCVFFVMELVWYRMLGAILGGTTFTFGLILAVALTGIGIGGALYSVLYRNRASSVRDFGLICGWEALAIAVPFALGDRLALFAHVLQGMRYFGFGGQMLGWAVVATIAILPAAMASGIQFPLLIGLLGRGNRNLGRQVGQAFAWNTLGAMVGSLAGGFGLLPLLSAPGAWKASAIVLIALAFIALAIAYRTDRRPAPLLHPLLATASAALCLAAVGPTAVWRHSAIGAGRARPPAVMNATWNELQSWMHDRRRMIMWEADGIEASVAIANGGSVAFIVNGKSDGNAVTDAPTQVMFPVLGAILHVEPRESLVIGLGTGESAGWLAALPTMERVDVVELEPAIARVAEKCAPLNNNVLKHEKVRVVYTDAREIVQTSQRQYDIIASEPSNPYRWGVSSLYTLDFYEHVRRRLKPGGLFIQWLQGYEIDVPTVRMVLATLHRAFPFVEIWETKPGDMVLICSAERPTYDLAQLKSRVSEPGYREALRIGWRATRVEGLLAHFVANEKFVALVTAQESIPLNTDNRNLLEYRFARSVGRGVDFSVAQMREDARSRGYGRPLHIAEGVDWEAVQDQLIAYHVALNDPPLILPPVSGERAQRTQSLQHYFHENLNAIVPAWQSQMKPPDDVIESIVVALGYAERGDEKALPLIERLSPENPVDAQIVNALLLHRQGNSVAAASFLEKAFTSMRTDATALPRLVDVAYSVAGQVAKADSKQAQKLFDALSKPFAVWLLNERRRMMRCLIAQQVSYAATAIAIDEMEPQIPWDEPFLTMRRTAYEAIGNPLLAKARRDLAEFRRHAGESHVIRGP
jgi:predicted membrane-bound spermidine synthase